ncbi:MAG TPA: FHA domain-containing protein, partial [Pyrinomonadaceae bacterium]|nr:FHA domain-containing protein [Pyrinomonadaceae bacterium]
MKITLAEVRDAQPPLERVFEKPLVVVGRDPQQCDVVYDQNAWPMVSRRHAEFRLQDGRCLLVDAKSSFGTLVNGQRVTEPVEVVPGSSVQFGEGGPVMLIARVENNHGVAPPKASTKFATQVDENAAPAPPSSVQARTVGRSVPQTTGLAYLEYVSGMSSKPERVRLDKPQTLLGRDPASSVPIDADAAAVSRRHAEIRRDGENQFVLVDLHSFNGTLLNNQRIAAPAPLRDGDRIQLGLGGPVFRLVDPAHPSAAPAAEIPIVTPSGSVAVTPDFQRTMVVRGASGGAAKGEIAAAESAAAQLLTERSFDAGKPFLTVGRSTKNDIHLDGLQISNFHARFFRNNNAQVF